MFNVICSLGKDCQNEQDWALGYECDGDGDVENNSQGAWADGDKILRGRAHWREECVDCEGV